MKQNKNKPAGRKTGGFKKSILSVFAENPSVALNHKQIAGRMGINDKSSRELLANTLDELAKAGELTEQKRGKFKIAPGHPALQPDPGNIVTGKVDMKPSGKAFITGSGLAEDVYVAPPNNGRALDGDTVKVLLFPPRKGHKREGQIVEIVKRGRENFPGVLQTGKYYSFFIPDSNSIPYDFLIPNDAMNGAKDGDKVIIRMTSWPERSGNPTGEVVQVLGRPGTHEVEMQSILIDFGFPLSFPEAVEQEAASVPAGITASEVKRRKDFRKVFTITIDPEDAKDFDDALSLRKLENGNTEVGIHIADVSHYVKQGSLVDQEAYERGTSVYLVDRTIPMLPEKLSNQLCSLRPGEDKLCFAAVFELGPDAGIISEWFGKTVICSDIRFDYDEVQEIIDGKEHPHAEEILEMNKLASMLRQERFKKGSIAFETEEVKFRLDEAGKPLNAYIKEYKDSNKLIEDFMLLANRCVAEYVSKLKINGKPAVFVYRVHDAPNPQKLLHFSEFISKLGFHIKTTNRKSLSQSFNDLFRKIKGRGEENLISNLAIRTMAKALYSTDNAGHYGLAFPFYTHFTSPIRRYPDLMVHRMLENHLAGLVHYNKEEYEQYCMHSSEMERRATEAERASVKYKQVEFMLDKVGLEFDGLISGISKWGMYVELLETKCEGMVSLRDMNDDYYYIDEDNYTATGQAKGKKYRLGDKIRIKVKKIDLSKKIMDFVPVK